ncbi:MAG: ParB/RepB/Spo0J family partition protein [Planctomycetes bacterium]|nr:ParB/RepB/Spo0J family partition protein [Planctomycetota bacterium]
MEQKRLGRGLEALYGRLDSVKLSNNDADGTQKTNSGSVIDVPISQIKENPYQPRSRFAEDSIENLAKSIQHNGMLQPLVASKINGTYQLICGERRLRALKKLGYTTAKVIVHDKCNDEDLLKKALVENVNREDLNPIEKAEGLQLLNKKFSLTHEQIADSIGMSRTGVTNLIRLLELPVEIQDAVRSDLITAGHARAILQVNNLDKRNKLISKIVKDNLTVRQAEQLARKFNTVSAGSEDSAGTAENYDTNSIASFLEESLLTKVSIEKAGKLYKLNIQFNSLDELIDFASRLGYTAG